jgi:hypothetical protein
VRCWVSYVYVCCSSAAAAMDEWMNGWMDGRTRLCVGGLASRPGLRPCVRRRRSVSRKLGRGRLPLLLLMLLVLLLCSRLVNLLSYCGLMCAPACRRDVGAKTLQRSMSSKVCWLYVAARMVFQARLWNADSKCMTMCE